MSKRETYEAKTEEILLPIAEENGVEIYDGRHGVYHHLRVLASVRSLQYKQPDVF